MVALLDRIGGCAGDCGMPSVSSWTG